MGTVLILLAALLLFAGAAEAGIRKLPDLNVRFADGPAAATAGEKMKVTDSIRNLGNKKAAASKVAYFLSKDDELSAKDKQLRGRRAIDKLEAGARDKGNAMVRVPKNVKSGDYELIACADDGDEITEGDESNNCQDGNGTVAVESGSSSGLTITPGDADFGEVPVGSRSAGVTYTVKNNGGKVTELGVGTSGGNVTEFVLNGGNCLGATLQHGESCIVVMALAPFSVGPKSSELEIATTATKEYHATMTGTAIEPDVQIEPYSYFFGHEPSSYTYTLKNNAATPATIGAITTSGAQGSDFTVQTNNCTGEVVAPGATCTFEMHFQPGGSGARYGTLNVASNFETSHAQLIGYGLSDAR